MKAPCMVLLFWCVSGVRAAPFAADNIVAMDSSGHTLYEMTPAGTLIQTITMQPANSTVAGQPWMDMTVGPDGNVHVYEGAANPYLSTYNTSTRIWSHHTEPAWNAAGTTLHGGIAAFGNAVFVTDALDDNWDSTGGIVRFTLPGYTARRFDGGVCFLDVTLGQDGLLYALASAPVTQALSIRVYDPATMALRRTVALPSGVDASSIAVDRQGHIFAVNQDYNVYHLRPDGTLLTSAFIQLPDAELTNIAVNEKGKVAIGTDAGFILKTDTTLQVFGAMMVNIGAPLRVAFTNAAIATMPGDLNRNGAVEAGDAVITLRLASGLQNATAADRTLADVRPKPGPNGAAYGDGLITLVDALAIFRKAAAPFSPLT